MLIWSLAGWSLLLLLWRLIVAHLQIVNEGSPTADAAMEIADITLAQAFYGRLDAASADYYRFTLTTATDMRLSMLIPERSYQAGFRPSITLSGTGLPAEGCTLPAADMGTHRGTTIYQRTQQDNLRLQPGRYIIEIRSSSAGVYCFCCGSREPTHYADAATRARVAALLNS